MPGLDLILLLILFLYVVLRAQRGGADAEEDRAPPEPEGGTATRGDPIQEALARWEEQIRRREAERRGAEARDVEAREVEAREVEARGVEPREPEPEPWVAEVERLEPREPERVASPSERTLVPSTGRGSAGGVPAGRRRGPASLAALEHRPPLHRAILYAEIVGAPRGLRPHAPPDTLDRTVSR